MYLDVWCRFSDSKDRLFRHGADVVIFRTDVLRHGAECVEAWCRCREVFSYVGDVVVASDVCE